MLTRPLVSDALELDCTKSILDGMRCHLRGKFRTQQVMMEIEKEKAIAVKG
jgi:hypothetical protein